MAWRAAQDIENGWYVNLGIGLPTQVSDHIPAGREIVFHSENGLLGMGPKPGPNEADPDLINAGKGLTTLITGGSFFHHADAFLMIRGGHLDLSIMGAFEVSQQGDLANWTTEDPTSRRAWAAPWTLRSAPGACACCSSTRPRTAARASRSNAPIRSRPSAA
jgi:3-oxoadipate CoA-transferase, beta subunit